MCLHACPALAHLFLAGPAQLSCKASPACAVRCIHQQTEPTPSTCNTAQNRLLHLHKALHPQLLGVFWCHCLASLYCLSRPHSTVSQQEQVRLGRRRKHLQHAAPHENTPPFPLRHARCWCITMARRAHVCTRACFSALAAPGAVHQAMCILHCWLCWPPDITACGNWGKACLRPSHATPSAHPVRAPRALRVSHAKRLPLAVKARPPAVQAICQASCTMQRPFLTHLD